MPGGGRHVAPRCAPCPTPCPDIPYAQLGDEIVGATRSAPPNQVPIWTRGTLLFSHWSITENPLILADLARSLRDEPPLLTPGPPPPRD